MVFESPGRAVSSGFFGFIELHICCVAFDTPARMPCICITLQNLKGRRKAQQMPYDLAEHFWLHKKIARSNHAPGSKSCDGIADVQNVLMSYATDSWTAYFRVMNGMNFFFDVSNSCT